MAQSKYFRYEGPRRQQYAQDDAGTRGLAAGVAAGKLLSGLAGGIQEMQKNAVANRLMDEASISEQPGAGQTQDLGKLGGGDGSDSDTSSSPTTQDLGTAPIDQTFTNPATGDIEPLQQDDSGLQQAVTAARLSSGAAGPTVGSTMTAPAAPTTQPSAPSGNFTLNPKDYSAGSKGPGTVGGLVHTGGVDEMNLQKEMLAMKLSKSQEGRAAAEEADKEAERQGTGRYALDAATKRLQLAKLQAEVDKANRPEKPDKNAPPANIDSEPVRDTNQLGDYVDNQYGNGTYSGLISAAATSATGDELAVAPTDPNAPVVKNPDGSIKPTPPPSIYQSNPDGTPKYDAEGNRAIVAGVTVPVPVGGKDPNTGAQKVINMPLKDAQTYIRQTNLQRLRQGLPPFRVPGEEQDVGATPQKPFIAHNKMEAQSRAPNTYVRLPNGQVVLWQGLKRTRTQ